MSEHRQGHLAAALHLDRGACVCTEAALDILVAPADEQDDMLRQMADGPKELAVLRAALAKDMPEYRRLTGSGK